MKSEEQIKKRIQELEGKVSAIKMFYSNKPSNMDKDNYNHIVNKCFEFESNIDLLNWGNNS